MQGICREQMSEVGRGKPPVEHQFKPGQSGNPAGKKPGTKHLSTHIQEMLNDDSFELKLKDGTLLKERPIAAIIKTAVAKSISGDNKWAEWLAKHGYGEKLQLEINDPRKEILEKYLGGDDEKPKDATE